MGLNDKNDGRESEVSTFANFDEAAKLYTYGGRLTLHSNVLLYN